MNFFVIVVLLAAVSEAMIQFKTSQYMSQVDINSNSDGVPITCPDPGCTVYTTKMIAPKVGIIDDGKQVATLDEIYKKENGYLDGYKLKPGSNYRLKKTQAGALYDDVTVYIVADSAGTGYVTDMDFDKLASETYVDLNPAGKRIVTVLNSYYTGMIFSKYEGTAPPKVYSAGFDMVNTCKTMYTASSVENAAKSSINIISAIATVDFGSSDDANRYHVSSGDSWSVHISIGQSFLVMSPGYPGCSGLDYNYNDYNFFPEYFIFAGAESTRADVNFGDMRISKGHELTLDVTGKQNQHLMVAGSSTQNYAFVSTNLELNLRWDQHDKNDYFSAQIDLTKGVTRAFKISTLLVLLFRVL